MILEYKNTTIFYTDEGIGDVIVLLHGFLENTSMWKNLMPHLTKNHRVISIDLLGHGKTGCIGYIHTMEQMSNAVDATLKYLKVDTFTFIAHSMGGYVALAYAKKNANKLKGLCLMNSTYEADSEERKIVRTRANKMVQTNFENVVRLSFTNLFSEKSRQLYASNIKIALTEAFETSLQGYIAAQEGMKIREDSSDLFKKLSCKKLIIIGEKDSIINSEKLINDLENTSINIVKLSQGHMSHIENKEEFTYNVLRFVENYDF